MALDQIKGIIRDNIFDDVHLIGFMDQEDNKPAEFVANTEQFFLEFGDHFIKIETIEQYSKIAISVVSDIQVNIDLEDVLPAKSKIGSVIFNNPLATNKVSKLLLFSMEVESEVVICDALKLVLSNKQEIFFDPSFLGLNVGSSEVEKFWRENQKQDSILCPMIITF
ncbi:hypothetical protein [Paenibacillus sp. 7523-1]|uniref:hypothetical protein n=1 Tax=Paenibacillus sp. 7523-1 TaxID=2022550 RepID=UPI000BA4E7A2|nr:hypothetical protein [Paenibacillus sp. 7523-1]PAD30900.1 hypothetical protein CHH60_13195 [Paenibacillus sp. 7523-1]